MMVSGAADQSCGGCQSGFERSVPLAARLYQVLLMPLITQLLKPLRPCTPYKAAGCVLDLSTGIYSPPANISGPFVGLRVRQLHSGALGLRLRVRFGMLHPSRESSSHPSVRPRHCASLPSICPLAPSTCVRCLVLLLLVVFALQTRLRSPFAAKGL